MMCKCGYQNTADAKYCAHCGRRLSGRKGTGRKWLAVAACLAITGIGICNILSGRTSTEKENGGMICFLPVQEKTEIKQVLPAEDGSVAVLYTDGTVRLSDNSPLAEAVFHWNNVEKLYCDQKYFWQEGDFRRESCYFGLTEDGSVLATDGTLSDWQDVKDLLFTWQGAVGVTNGGDVLTEDTWEDEASRQVLEELSDVETLVYSDIQTTFACLKKDGTVTLISEGGYLDPYKVHWDNVKEVRDSGHSFYVIRHDGSVAGGVGDEPYGLAGAVKVADYQDWLFGISEDGRLLTQNGGNIYTNTGDLMLDAPGSSFYGGEVDISRFDQVRDITVCWGLILMNRDGTVESVGSWPEWDLSAWNHVEKVCSASDEKWENITLYGIKSDGSVVTTRYNSDSMEQTVTDRYLGWSLQDIYPCTGGVVGLTTDGDLVGDGIYADIDFSVFRR